MPSPKPQSFKAPTGTRDLYPEEQLRQRYITDVWRRVSLRHGFDEIDGPTFEHSGLYAVKSGDGILGELFQAFSGKSPDEIAAVRDTGRAPFALRPEFTPTLARMYAARANQLPKPVRWFSVCNYFRAERPQRGRLREFLQWNADVIGLSGDASPAQKAEADAELVVMLAESLAEFGLSASDLAIRVNDRETVGERIEALGIGVDRAEDVLRLLDAWAKMDPGARKARAREIGLSDDQLAGVASIMEDAIDSGPTRALIDLATGLVPEATVRADPSIVRGLAYYTGTVFEAIAEGERAVAGGGRYDNLIELLGGPPTPACGFAMGDVVLGNLLDDKGLMPSGQDMLEALSKPMPVRPDAFVIASNDEAAAQVVPLVAQLRRGTLADDAPERKPWDDARFAVPPLHARRSSKATRNVGKLLKEASQHYARFAVIIESPDSASIKDLDANAQTSSPVPLAEVAGAVSRRDLSAYL